MWSYLCVYSEKKKNRKKGEPNFSSILAQNTDINTNPLFVRLIIAGTNILHMFIFCNFYASYFCYKDANRHLKN